MSGRKVIHLLNERGWFTACGRPAGTLHTDGLAAVTCHTCKHSAQARRQREGT